MCPNPNSRPKKSAKIWSNNLPLTKGVHILRMPFVNRNRQLWRAKCLKESGMKIQIFRFEKLVWKILCLLATLIGSPCLAKEVSHAPVTIAPEKNACRAELQRRFEIIVF